MIAVLGGGNLNFGGTIPSLISKEEDLVVFTGDMSKFHYDKKEVIINGKYEYTIIPVTENGILPDQTFNGQKNVAYTSITQKCAIEILANCSCIISACRSGILGYVPILDKIIPDDKEMVVYLLDNDQKYLMQAINASKNRNIRYEPAVAHLAVTDMNISDKVYITAGKNAKLVFPPSMNNVLDSTPGRRLLWETTPELRIARNNAQFQFHVTNKLASINAQHTYQVVIAVKRGIIRGEKITEIQEKPLSAYITYDEAIKYAEKLHIIAYAYLLYKITNMDGYKEFETELFNYKAHLDLMKSFLFDIYSCGDKIKRGIDYNKKDDAASKYERHITILSEVISIFSDHSTQKDIIGLMKTAGMDTDSEVLEEALTLCEEIIETAAKFYK